MLALDLQEMLELGNSDFPGFLVLGQETHGHGILAGRRKVDLRILGPVAQKPIGNLNQNPGAVANQRVCAHGAPVIEIDQNLKAAGNHLMGFSALDIGHKPHAARIMLVARIVQTLLFRSAHSVPQSTKIQARSNAAARAVKACSGGH